MKTDSIFTLYLFNKDFSYTRKIKKTNSHFYSNKHMLQYVPQYIVAMNYKNTIYCDLLLTNV